MLEKRGGSHPRTPTPPVRRAMPARTGGYSFRAFGANTGMKRYTIWNK